MYKESVGPGAGGRGLRAALGDLEVDKRRECREDVGQDLQFLRLHLKRKYQADDWEEEGGQGRREIRKLDVVLLDEQEADDGGVVRAGFQHGDEEFELAERGDPDVREQEGCGHALRSKRSVALTREQRENEMRLTRRALLTVQILQRSTLR